MIEYTTCLYFWADLEQKLAETQQKLDQEQVQFVVCIFARSKTFLFSRNNIMHYQAGSRCLTDTVLMTKARWKKFLWGEKSLVFSINY